MLFCGFMFIVIPFFSFAHFPPSSCRYAVPLFAFSSLLSGPLSPPHPLCFPPVIFFRHRFYAFLFHILTSNHAILPHSFEQLLSLPLLSVLVISPLSIMFSSSCYVAHLAHHPPLIKNQEDFGGRLFLLIDRGAHWIDVSSRRQQVYRKMARVAHDT